MLRKAIRVAVGTRSGSALLIEGPAGIGKTSLLDAASGLARGLGAAVLRACGGQLERTFSFGIARQLLEAKVAALGAGERERVFDGAARWATPAVDPRAAAVPYLDDAAAGGERAFMVSHGLYWLVCNLTDTMPLFLAVDDGQWCDDASARFLGYLTRRLEDLPVLLAIAVRTGEPGSNTVGAALEGYRPQALRLRPLSDAAASELVRRKLAKDAAEDFCSECRRVSGGNPFLLTALLDELAAEQIAPVSANARRLTGVQPPAVTRSLLARLARLGPQAGALARAVAVLGNAELQEAAALAETDVPAAARAAGALTEADLVARQQSLEFAHPLVQEVVYESIAPTERALYHARAAQLFGTPVPDYERMASHLLRAIPAGDAAAVGALREAARIALDRGASEVACAYLRRALREPPQNDALPGVTREFAVAELLAREPSAVEHLYDALALATDPAPRAEIALLLGKALVNAGRLADADAVLTAVISEVGDRDLKRAARLETWRTGIGLLDWRFRAGVEQRLPRLRSLAERSGLDGRALLVLLACRAAMNGAARAEVLELVSSAFGDGRFLGAETADDLPLPFMMRLLAWVDELDRADQVHHGLLSAARRGSIEAFAIAAVCAASTALRRGALAAAEAEARTAIELARQHNIKDYEPFARALLGEALLERGDLGQAAAAVDGIDFEWMREMGPGSLLLYVRGRLRAARGDRQGAAADLRECGRIHELNGYRNPNIVPWQSALALVVPDTPEGRSLVAAELSRARKAGQPRAIGVALRAMALLSGRHERIPLLREAAETLRSSPSALELARTLTDYGAALARTGQGTSAREPLQQGMDLAARCGAAALARRAREDLLAIGARPRRERLTGAESLTPGELGVARLAAEGLTNRQIAQALFISTKTVGTHLGHIYDKIGTSSREGLAQIMREASRAAQ